jgi:hypothetical protein
MLRAKEEKDEKEKKNEKNRFPFPPPPSLSRRGPEKNLKSFR